MSPPSLKKEPPKQGCVFSESLQSGLTHYPTAANEAWSSCSFIGPLSENHQNCARYTRVEITQNCCCLKGAKLLMQHVESKLQLAAFLGM